VEYTSAHLDGVPEKIVRSGHSVQSHPQAIAEVRRILLEHAAGLDAAEPTSEISVGPAPEIEAAHSER
jgi:hypothetical protein